MVFIVEEYMRIKITADNVCIGMVNFGKGSIIEYAAPGSLKDVLVKLGKAEYTQEAVNADPVGALGVEAEEVARLPVPDPVGVADDVVDEPESFKEAVLTARKARKGIK